MKKFVRSLLAAAAFAAGTGALVVTAPSPAEAQTKADPKGTPKVDPKGKAADPKVEPKTTAKGTVVIKPGKDGKFRFFVRDEDDKTLMQSSTGYVTEEDAQKMLDAAKAILGSAKVTKEKADSK